MYESTASPFLVPNCENPKHQALIYPRRNPDWSRKRHKSTQIDNNPPSMLVDHTQQSTKPGTSCGQMLDASQETSIHAKSVGPGPHYSCVLQQTGGHGMAPPDRSRADPSGGDTAS
ncbi:hypothetical protein J3F83DRAFT_738428 [Trichoderma novae-zelandiae]